MTAKPELSREQLHELIRIYDTPGNDVSLQDTLQAAYALGLAAGMERAAQVAEQQPYKYKATRGIAAAIREAAK